MARTVAARREPDLTERPPYRDRSVACSFCTDRTKNGVRHDMCPGEIHTNPGRRDNRAWTCACWREGHPE